MHSFVLRLLLFVGHRMCSYKPRTVVYIDGFNLYYRALKKTSYKWLNLDKLCSLALPKNDVVWINYYTARVSSRSGNTSAPKDQQTYLNALTSIPSLTVHYGSFNVHQKMMYLCKPLRLAPKCSCTKCSCLDLNPEPKYASVLKSEEKGSDVNLGVHLVRDAFLGNYECAVVITNDTDLAEPIRIVAHELKKPIGVLFPVSTPAQGLVQVSSFQRHINPQILKNSQFDTTVKCGNGQTVSRPNGW